MTMQGQNQALCVNSTVPLYTPPPPHHMEREIISRDFIFILLLFGISGTRIYFYFLRQAPLHQNLLIPE